MALGSAFQDWAAQYGIQPMSPIGRGLSSLGSGVEAAAQAPLVPMRAGYEVGSRLPEIIGRGLVGLTQNPEPEEPGLGGVEVSESAVVPNIQTSSTGLPVEGPRSTVAPPTNPHGTSAPDESPLFSPAEWSAMGQQHAAATYKPQVRAIRMPNGHMLFTNRDEYGGEEFTPEQGGKIVRQQQRGMAPPTPPPFEGDLTRSAMTALVRASARATAGERPPGEMRGRMVEGKAPDTSGGAVSMIEGTPEMQLQMKQEEADKQAALAESGMRLKYASMSPGDLELLKNPHVQAMVGASRLFLPQIQQAQSEMDARIKLVSTPGSPSYIADPGLQKTEIMKAQMKARSEMAPYLTLASLGMGVRPVGLE